MYFKKMFNILSYQGYANWNITKCYSDLKKKEVMLFVGKWIELEIITLSDINQV
jgi:hypothetical protein